MLSAGNDSQFRILCSPELFNVDWANDERFSTNTLRVENRAEMIRLIEEVLGQRTTAEWCERLKGKGLPFA
jgi:succinate--hydroxymethylglutarate CoA-transferase